MEEKNMRELKTDEMSQVSGGMLTDERKLELIGMYLLHAAKKGTTEEFLAWGRSWMTSEEYFFVQANCKRNDE